MKFIDKHSSRFCNNDIKNVNHKSIGAFYPGLDSENRVNSDNSIIGVKLNLYNPLQPHKLFEVQIEPHLHKDKVPLSLNQEPLPNLLHKRNQQVRNQRLNVSILYINEDSKILLWTPSVL